MVKNGYVKTCGKGLESIRRDFGLKIREKIIESYFCELYSRI